MKPRKWVFMILLANILFLTECAQPTPKLVILESWPGRLAGERMTAEQFTELYNGSRQAAMKDCSRQVWGTDAPPRPGIDMPAEEIGDYQQWLLQWDMYKECMERRGFKY